MSRVSEEPDYTLTLDCAINPSGAASEVIRLQVALWGCENNHRMAIGEAEGWYDEVKRLDAEVKRLQAEVERLSKGWDE